MIIGHKIYHFDTIGSTNTALKEKALAGEPEGTVILADEQTAGRGRFHKQWISPKGMGLYFSVLLRPQVSQEELSFVSLCPVLAVIRTIKSLCKLNAGVKWPNDVVIDGKKVCGVLSEANTTASRVNFIVTGIGVNLYQTAGDFPPEIAASAGSVTMFSHKWVDKKSLFRNILVEFNGIYEQIKSPDGKGKIVKEWMSYCDHANAPVVLFGQKIKIEGAFLGIDQNGYAVIKSEGKTHSFAPGQFSLRKNSC
jgi:BirA family biotin operon repressor/biotin-[acetyl-CoA-carboxylase] ligase